MIMVMTCYLAGRHDQGCVVVLQVDMITAYEGDKEKLGNAEKFYLQLSRLPAYQIRIEGMLLKVS